VLGRQSQASVGEVLRQFPATQGLGSVVGLVSLGKSHGQETGGREQVGWVGNDGEVRSAWIPQMYFLRERASGLDQL
jgi:hypothetical protein